LDYFLGKVVVVVVVVVVVMITFRLHKKGDFLIS